MGGYRLMAGIAAILAPMPAVAAEEAEATAPIVVTAPGGAVDLDDAISLTGEDIARAGRPDLLGALTRQIAGISLQDAQNNPWQPNLVYRGFTASPLQGQAPVDVPIDRLSHAQPDYAGPERRISRS